MDDLRQEMLKLVLSGNLTVSATSALRRQRRVYKEPSETAGSSGVAGPTKQPCREIVNLFDIFRDNGKAWKGFSSYLQLKTEEQAIEQRPIVDKRCQEAAVNVCELPVSDDKVDGSEHTALDHRKPPDGAVFDLKLDVEHVPSNSTGCRYAPLRRKMQTRTSSS